MSLEIVSRCPVCQQNSFHPYLLCKDYSVSGELFHVKQCAGCGLLVTTPRPDIQASVNYYQSSKYISHKTSSQGLFESIYLIIRRFTNAWKYRLIAKHLKTNQLLDVGCGSGSFLKLCQTKGVEVYGIEPSTDARAQTKDLRVYPGLENLPSLQFDVITMWHVIEHVYDLEKTINQLKEKLVDDGVLILAVPNWKSFDAIHYKDQWAAFDVPRHLWHFSQEVMQKLITKAGFKLLRTIPMKLDAYYVSLLSEKNNSPCGLTFIHTLKAFTIGFKSNYKARREKNYSSLIYLLQK